MEQPSLDAIWQKAELERASFLKRAIENSRFTDPSLYPEGTNSRTYPGRPVQEVRYTFQSLGAEGLANLQSHITLQQIPHDVPFFRAHLPIDRNALSPDNQVKVREKLAEIDLAILERIQELHVRQIFTELVPFLLVGGTCVIDYRYADEMGMPCFHTLEDVALMVGPRKEINALVVREGVAFEDLPEHGDMMARLTSTSPSTFSMEQPIVFTGLVRQPDGRLKMWQEVHFENAIGKDVSYKGGYVRPNTEQYFDSDEDAPLHVVTTGWHNKENYGRAWVDPLLPDLASFNGLTQALVEAAVFSSENKILVRPGGATQIADLEEAENGAYIPGREEDIGVVNQRQNLPDLSWAFQVHSKLEERLSRRFLMFLGVRREGERVTAEEIARSAFELDKGTGGLPARLQLAFQRPLALWIWRNLKENDRVASIVEELEQHLPEGEEVGIEFTTGVETLGQAQYLQRLTMAAQTLNATIGADAFISTTHIPRLVREVYIGAGIPDPSFVKTEEELAQDQAQEHQRAMALQAAGPLTQAAIQQ